MDIMEVVDLDLDTHIDTVEDITHTTQTIHTITHTTMITMITIILTITTTTITMIMILIITTVMSLDQHKDPLLLMSKQPNSLPQQNQKDRMRQMQWSKVSPLIWQEK